MNKKRLIKIVLASVLLLVLFVVLYRNVYSENWIVGKTKEQIERRYGEFDRLFDFEVIEERGDILQQADYGYVYFSKERYNVKYYYIVFFNCEGVAIRTERNWHVPGN